MSKINDDLKINEFKPFITFNQNLFGHLYFFEYLFNSPDFHRTFKNMQYFNTRTGN